jgi:Na+-transporting NADH:ubiquinone oxidoreductase subunit NqrE
LNGAELVEMVIEVLWLCEFTLGIFFKLITVSKYSILVASLFMQERQYQFHQKP